MTEQCLSWFRDLASVVRGPMVCWCLQIDMSWDASSPRTVVSLPAGDTITTASEGRNLEGHGKRWRRQLEDVHLMLLPRSPLCCGGSGPSLQTATNIKYQKEKDEFRTTPARRRAKSPDGHGTRSASGPGSECAPLRSGQCRIVRPQPVDAHDVARRSLDAPQLAVDVLDHPRELLAAPSR
jgi:hypothetical protein